MNYEQAMNFIEDALVFGSKLGLDTIKDLLNRVSNPQKQLKFVHVAGTNGKGSFCAFLTEILMSSGYKVGTFTSPHVVEYAERIRVNKKNITNDSIVKQVSKIKLVVDEMKAENLRLPTEFEIAVAVALLYFAEQKVDIVIWEVGLGGRLDATNVIENPLLSVITSIDLDHQKQLGETIVEIAQEKGGIFKRNCQVLSYDCNADVRKVFEKLAKRIDSPIYFLNENNIKNTNIKIDSANSTTKYFQIFDYKNSDNLIIQMLGAHQIRNAALAFEACNFLQKNGFGISDNARYKGLRNTKWDFRFDVFRDNPTIIFDGAHNIAGVKVLKETLISYFPQKKFVFVMGVMKDKDFNAMVEEIVPLAKNFITVTPNSSRSLPAKELGKVISDKGLRVVCASSIKDAAKLVNNYENTNEIICIFGSFYYISDIKNELLLLNSEE